jgi:hypothetical protein
LGKKSLLLLVCGVFLASCSPLWAAPAPPVVLPTRELDSGLASLTPFLPDGVILPTSVTAIPVSGVASQTPVPQYIWISPTVPEGLRQAAMLSGLALTGDSAAANVRLDLTMQPGSRSASWIYALVAPFPTTVDSLSIDEVQNAWAGTASGPFAGQPLWMAESTLAAFSALWGPPAAGSVRVGDSSQLVDSTWSDRPSWGIVPFEELEPRWKTLSVDGQSPVHNDFDPAAYPLKINFNVEPAAFPLPPSNRDPDKITVLAMTGVTALVRATADQMEHHGVLYPGEEVRSVLRLADVTHISNEVPFMAGCPVPDPWTESMLFCSDPRYITLLEDIGTDVVELTGNHQLDYGPGPLLDTLDMYDQRNWLYFGGGRDLQDSFQPALMEDHGNKLAFFGCNFAGPPSDLAREDRPGSTPCDFSRLETEIADLRTQGYLAVMTFQYSEYYQPFPTVEERSDFTGLAAAGAVIISGSQAHVPASMEFSGESFIHFGLGNLFFDQMSHLMPDGSLIYDTRNVFIDRHIIYNGHYIGTELLTYMIENYARPRLMTGPERLQLLNQVFDAAGW